MQIRDMNAGRFGSDGTIVLVTHGVTLRVFLMRWMHWTIDQFLQVDNPGHAVPIVLEKVRPGAHTHAMPCHACLPAHAWVTGRTNERMRLHRLPCP